MFFYEYPTLSYHLKVVFYFIWYFLLCFSEIPFTIDCAFADCSALTSITIPDTVTSIGGVAFYRCSALSKISFNGTVEQWNAVSKGSYWDSDTGDYTVYCTNGEIAKEP